MSQTRPPGRRLSTDISVYAWHSTGSCAASTLDRSRYFHHSRPGSVFAPGTTDISLGVVLAGARMASTCGGSVDHARCPQLDL